jgi:hypothetical protein
MINTNFNIGFEINRERLYDLLLDKINIINFKFEPLHHAGVHLKFNNISVFIFEKGSIIIIVNDMSKIIKTY